MTDSADETKEGTPEAAPAAATETAEAVAFAEEEVQKDAEPAKEPDPLEVAKAESAKFREQLLRTAADFDNFRKRARREVDEASRKGLEKALKELLPVFDNLERATVSAEQAPDVKSVADGLKMVGRQFTTTLEKLQVKRIQAVGVPFDPTQHEAIQHVESTEHAAGVVTHEVQAGYLIGDVLLRAAMVVVSKGGPATSEPSESASDGAASPEGEAN
jgi:molecular chaperone GrpE